MDDTSARPKTTPKDFFLYLAAAITLYISSGSLLALLFEVINSAFPDALNPVYYGGFSNPGIRWAVASLVIIFPLYLFLSWFIRKDVVAHVEKAHIAIRRWFIYFTLFAAGAAVVIDLVTLLNTFLGGEITIRFTLKVLAVLIVAGTVFAYYLYDLRRTDRGDAHVRVSFVWGAAAVVLASIVGGFIVMGSPTAQRDFRFDEQRVSALQSIQWQVINYWQTKAKLPSALSDLQDDITGFRVPTDPTTGAVYEYTTGAPLSFEVCATFVRETPKSAVMKDYPILPSDAYGVSENWKHGAGRTCFTRVIDPDKFPSRSK